MRVYFEKPRTTVGWKGLINDPNLDDSATISSTGLRTARKLLLVTELNDMGMPAGVEFLDILTPQYLADLVSAGARSVRAPRNRSCIAKWPAGLSCAGRLQERHRRFSVKVAVDAVQSARSARIASCRLTQEGQISIFETAGNADCHVILRGGSSGTNYDAKSVDAACAALTKAGLKPQVMVDFSHANSQKQHKRQVNVGEDVGHQIAGGDERIVGVMIESHLVEGRQEIGPDMVYGQSITDACIHWDDTTAVLGGLAASVAKRGKRLVKSA